MKKPALVFLGSLLIGAAAASAQSPTPSPPPQAPAAVPAEPAPEIAAGDPKIYGEYPTSYRQIVYRWLEARLADPTSAIIDWADAPKPGEYTTKAGKSYVGYVVDIKVNARNQFGAPTGKQRYRIVIRDHEVVWGGRPRY